MTPFLPFNAWCADVQLQVERQLETSLLIKKTPPSALQEAMAYAVLNGGKRVRPLLTFATGELFAAEPALLVRAAAAVEMIHAYSLVHDDMPCMDNDMLRRGKPAVHVQYGQAMALLAGDALQTQAFFLLSENTENSNLLHQLAMIRLLASASGMVGMCGGQALDLQSVGAVLSLPALETMHRLKTGALLRAAILLGAYCSEQVKEEELAALEIYAASIGLAFQIVDDILDVTTDSATLGKTSGKDQQQGKPTYVSVSGLEPSRLLVQKLYADAQNALVRFGARAKRLHELANLIVHRQA